VIKIVITVNLKMDGSGNVEYDFRLSNGEWISVTISEYKEYALVILLRSR
jgi:hypothetical protein